MRKYLTLIGLSFQRQLEVRSDFLFERARSLSIMLSLYFLWGALLVHQTDLLGYSRDQLLTYVLVMTLLRAWVLGAVTDQIPTEIARGKLSDVLLRPLSCMGYWAAQDVANKLINLLAAFVEVSVFMMIVSAPLLTPSHFLEGVGFCLTVAGGMILYFQMSYLLGVLGFWTAQSWGPRFCFEIVVEFCAGAYFPIDILPVAAQQIISFLPFPYLVFYPLMIFLGRSTAGGIFRCLAFQGVWMVLLGGLIHVTWKAGLRRYAAEGR